MFKLLKPLYALSATAVVLAAILLIGVAKHVAALQSGQELIIPARGYDPRAILLGHYVRLQPEASAIFEGEQAESIFNACAEDRERLQVAEGWLTFALEDDEWMIVDASVHRPREATNDQIFVQTRIDFSPVRQNEELISLQVWPLLEIDRYYANQAEALDIEQRLRDSKEVQVILSVNASGKPMLKGVVVDGERHVVSWW